MKESDIFMDALGKGTPEERAAYLDEACSDDSKLRQRIDTLLRSHNQVGSLLEHPAIEGSITDLCQDVGDHDDSPENPGSRTQTEPNAVPLDFLEQSNERNSLGRLAQYEITEVVGHGGMGIVLKAHDTKLNRIVAVKVLSPELAANATARKRFLREAQAAAAVSHDHVVTTYAVEEGDLPYLVMEFIDGQSLQQKIDRQGQLELKEILRIGRQVAAGLSAAHEQGLIHRDVKPSNILLQNGVERVQITDFGLARAVDDASITRTGEVTGTPQYMSPEQAQGHPVDARSDLFSLGSVLYAMCTGRSPFRAETTMASLRRVCDDTPRPVREVCPDIPDWLVSIIDRLLAKDPDDRFQTAAEVAELLSRHLAHLQDPLSTPLPGVMKPVRRQNGDSRRNRWMMAGVTLLAVLVGVGLTEATGITQFTATVIRIVTGEGTLVVVVDDPTVQVSIDGDQISISGGGVKELKLRPGRYKFRASKDGQPVKEELVTITRGGKQVVKISREIEVSTAVLSKPEPGAFVILGKKGIERKFDTLAEAVAGSRAGDTIEIRGNGPFVTDPIYINHALTIRAAEGFRPVIKNSPWGTQKNRSLMTTAYPLVLEGLEVIDQRTYRNKVDGRRGEWKVTLLCTGPSMHLSNCRFVKTWTQPAGDVSVGQCVKTHASENIVRNCEVVAPKVLALVWQSSPGGSLDTENCVYTGAIAPNPQSFGRAPTSVRIRRCTFFAGTTIYFQASRVAKPKEGASGIDFRATESIFDCWKVVLQVRRMDPTEAKTRIPKLIAWQDEHNAYAIADAMLKCGLRSVVRYDQGLAAWKEFWNEPDAQVLEGPIRFAGGDLRSRRFANPGELTAEDFRLRPDSAGYRAGPEGKDLGADIDLVGPGAAYERWKKTPEYQEWLKETRRLMQNRKHDGDAAASDEPLVVPVPEHETKKSDDKTEKPEEKAEGNNR